MANIKKENRLIHESTNAIVKGRFYQTQYLTESGTLIYRQVKSSSFLQDTTNAIIKSDLPLELYFKESVSAVIISDKIKPKISLNKTSQARIKNNVDYPYQINKTFSLIYRNNKSFYTGFWITDGFNIIFRLNSNIYKNIFPEEVTNMEYINEIIENTPITFESITQKNHGLNIYDAVYLDSDKTYKKAIAEDSSKSNVVGVVSKVSNSNMFTLMSSGKIDYGHLDYTDTSILYLSDKIPGKLVHYSNIDNKIYVPVAIYADNKILINIQQGSIGDKLAPYEEEILDFEPYEEQDLNDIISQVKGEILNGKKE